MVNKKIAAPAGSVEILTHTSACLADNPLGDPHERQLPVYLPAAYHRARQQHSRFPVLFDLAAYTASGLSHLNWRNFEENLPQRLDRLINSGVMPPCIVVMPDCFTSLGGNQYINSTGVGAYADYLTRELIPFVDKHFRTLPGREHRGCFGKSSGGYGALLHGMRYARYWGAIACHSGDVYFDFVYRTEWPGVLTTLQKFARPVLSEGVVRQRKKSSDDRRIQRFLDHCAAADRLDGDEITALMLLCMSATYDPDPNSAQGFNVPYNLHTGELIPERWRQWRKHDPVTLVSKYRQNLQKLQGLYIDCGWQDQYHLHFGTRQLAERLRAHQIKHHYEEFAGSHSGIDGRLDISLPYLVKRLG
ncbi:MAG: alpha/beta hydrolase-fold protein [Pseudomonadota bacterium]